MLYLLELDKDIEEEIIINLKDIRKIENVSYNEYMRVTYTNGDTEDIYFDNATNKYNQLMKMLKFQ